MEITIQMIANLRYQPR